MSMATWYSIGHKDSQVKVVLDKTWLEQGRKREKIK